jgi:hypothetical protein
MLKKFKKLKRKQMLGKNENSVKLTKRSIKEINMEPEDVKPDDSVSQKYIEQPLQKAVDQIYQQQKSANYKEKEGKKLEMQEGSAVSDEYGNTNMTFTKKKWLAINELIEALQEEINEAKS